MRELYQDINQKCNYQLRTFRNDIFAANFSQQHFRNRISVIFRDKK